MKRNFLLGKGERLTEEISVKSGGAQKDNPYSFKEAKMRLGIMLSEATSYSIKSSVKCSRTIK